MQICSWGNFQRPTGFFLAFFGKNPWSYFVPSVIFGCILWARHWAEHSGDSWNPCACGAHILEVGDRIYTDTHRVSEECCGEKRDRRGSKGGWGKTAPLNRVIRETPTHMKRYQGGLLSHDDQTQPVTLMKIYCVVTFPKRLILI